MPRTCARRQRPAIVGTGRVSVKELLRRSTYNNRISGLEKRINEDHHFAALFQRIHDLCLVWTSQIWSCMAAMESHPRIVADCAAGILPRGSRQSMGLRHIYGLSAEDHSRGDHRGGFHHLRHHLPEGENGLELRGIL